MSEPVLVVHGIANHDAEQFKKTVQALQKRVGTGFKLIEVFWGDLGGVSNGLKGSLPLLFPHIDTTRGDDDDGSAFFEMLQAQRLDLMGNILTRGQESFVVDALYKATLEAGGLSSSGIEITRGGDDAMREILAETIPDTRFLKTIHDPDLQRDVGRLLAEHLQARQPGGDFGQAGGEFATRGWFDDGREALRRFINGVDQLIGRVAATVAGSANQWVRGALANPIALTLGDIVAYHQRRADIHARLFEALDAHAPGHGTADRPITTLAHSLGGLVTFDAALGSDVIVGDSRRTLHIKHWVTFGSQPAFFHVLAPRHGIEPYAVDKPVALPSSIGGWTNLWHPLDMLAFAAGTVFRMADGKEPLDVRVDTPASEIIDRSAWLHSAYWDSPALLSALEPAS